MPSSVRNLGILSLTIYLVGGVVFQVLIDTPVSAAFDFTFRHLAVPIGVLVAGLVWMYRYHLVPRERRGRSPWLAAGLIYVALLIATPSYVLLANSVGASRQEITLTGPIVDKWTRSYKSTSYYLQIVDDRTGTKVTLNLSPAAYRSARVGSRFSRTFFMGRLGIPYRWTLE